ncbi:phospholipase [Lithospermum erythrorhizon]|uniref:Phospholipase n=1 Tax=Lithospermum erythrorhizon TaxID=34254 RepID=A0AAV3NUH3_LITER
MDIVEHMKLREETSPDMLTNSPSNIRRLADEIEQCEGRQKYLAQTGSPSDGGDVRWYFCKVPLAEKDLAASFPNTEIVGKGDYFRFGMRDSLAIEASFLQREEELLSSWWEEYAECSEGPMPRSRLTSKKKAHLEGMSPESTRSAHLLALDEERVGVPVKGGLYEVDLVKRHCFPVYWHGENRRVLRGHWFARKGGLDWLPLREDVSEQLEFAFRSRVWHRRTFQPSGLFAARVDLRGSTPGLNALFTGEDDTWEAWLSVEASGFSNVISAGGKSIQLRRGYAPSQSPKPTQDELRQQREEEMDDYCSLVPVGHLVFMVHGIGQRLGGKSSLVDDVTTFRQITESLADQHLTSYQRGTQRILYIPCQWRRGLKLGGEAAVETITLDGVRKLRVMLSGTVHDVLYYMSPIYCQEIIDSVSNQLNRLYLKFLKRNPGYDGKVSIYGHSLGSVLSYDILCHQETLSSPFPMGWMFEEHDRNEQLASHVNNQTSDTNFISTSKVENLSNDESEIIAGDADKVGIDQQPSPGSFSIENAQETCIPLDPPESYDSDEPSNDNDSKLEENSTVADDKNEDDSFDWSDLISFEGKGINKPPSSRAETTEPEEKRIDQEIPDRENETTIKSLLEEINMLKEKIRTLEGKGHEKIPGTSTGKTASEQSTPWKCDSRKSYTPYINYTKLAFKVDTFFAVGSPLGVFLSLRNVRIGIGEGHDYWEEENINEEMPACRQMFNIFHPFDPVAYRIEPLVCKEYIEKRPVIIPYHRGGKRLHIGFQEFTEGVASRSRSLRDRISSVTVKVLTVCGPRDRTGIEEGSDNDGEREERSYGSHMIERLTGAKDGRIDHVLQDKTFRHQYLSAIGSHTNYWRDYDTALFMLKHLYRGIPEEPSSSHEAAESSSRAETRYEGLYDQRDMVDEELPLTFADKALVRNFSRKAKRAMNA